MRSIGRFASVCVLLVLAGCLDTPIKRVTQDSSIHRPDGGFDAGPDADVPQPCESDEQCTDKRASRCGPDHLCIPCGDNIDCGKFPDAHACVPEVGCFECDTGETSACTGDTKVCDLATHACVQCTALDHVACTGETSHCDLQTGNCVECLTNAECTIAGASVCNEAHECESCTDDNGCSHMANNQTHCNTGKNKCVECFENAHCPLDNPVCDFESGTCRPCEHSTECGQREGTKVCFDGGCVECTADERDACKTADMQDAVCNANTHECENERPVASANACEDCVSDAECVADYACMETFFDKTSVGYYCLPVTTAGCSTYRPHAKYVGAAVSIDGTEHDVCALRYATCEAHVGAKGYGANCGVDSSNIPVSTGAVRGENDLCGREGLEDGFCASTAPGEYRCTVPCAASEDCPDLFGPMDPTCTTLTHETGSAPGCTL